MQHRESLFPVTGSVALKPQTQAKQARIIAFPATKEASDTGSNARLSRIRQFQVALTTFAHATIHRIDNMFALTAGTSKGIGPRYATKAEAAALFVTCTVIAALTIIL